MTNKLFSQGVKEAQRITLTAGEKQSMLAHLNAYLKEHPAEPRKFNLFSFLKSLLSFI